MDKDQNVLKAREKCIVCGMDTGYRGTVPIEKRQFYFEGVGQLCKRCYDEIYDENEAMLVGIRDRWRRS